MATARKVSLAEVANAVQTLTGWGLEVVLGETIGAESHQFAGPDELRRRDLQQQFNDPSIRAVFCARGGYGTPRIADELDFTAFALSPKWVVGFSDITVLHCQLLRLGFQSIHGPMAFSFGQAGDAAALASLRQVLFGEEVRYQAAPHPLNRPGTVRGELVGGNLSLLHTITGTASQVSFAGRILFLEDLDEYLYHIDRMLLHLHRSGQLAGVAGLAVGHFSLMRDNAIPFGQTAHEIIDYYARLHGFPVGYGFAIGHEADNRALIIGHPAQLTVSAAGAELRHLRPEVV